MRIALLLILLGAVGCTVPGQHFSARLPANSATLPDDLRIVRLSADVIAGQRGRTLSAVSSNPELQAQLASYEYRVGPRDILIFTVWDHPELTIPAGEFRAPEIQGHLVSTNGAIFFPYVGSIDVAGRSLSEIRHDITERLGRFIQNPQLDVRIAAFRSKRINVAGQVAAPGFFPVTDTPLTLVEALNLAGGPTPEAALQDVQVVRDGQTTRYDLLQLLQRGDLRQNVLLRDGDIVFIPSNDAHVVHVLGSVATPGAIPIVEGRLNLADAISRSEGFDSDTADPRRLLVFRNESGTPAVYWLDAKSPDAMLLATQFELKSQDVVFVASSPLARWNRVVSLILPTVQTLWQTQSFIDRLDE